MLRAQICELFRAYNQVLVVNHMHCFLYAHSPLRRHAMQHFWGDRPHATHIACMSTLHEEGAIGLEM